MKKICDVIIIGAGPAGLGMGRKLQELGINYLILEQGRVGESFSKWGESTRFITPSFPSNAFSQADLNAIDGMSSPGITAGREHLSGKEYADYLYKFSLHYNILVSEYTKVEQITKQDELFEIMTNKGNYTAKYICCAIGEFHFPSYGGVQGIQYCLHSSNYKNIEIYKHNQGVIPIIGGYESAIDAAESLIKQGKKVHIFSRSNIDGLDTTDPSRRLSIYSKERYKKLQESGCLTVTIENIATVGYDNGEYILKGDNEYVFKQQPIAATGFCYKYSLLGDLVTYNSDGFILLNQFDECEKTKNIFIVGPGVRQGNLIFCFIYKFRLRFGVIALEIAKRLGKNIDYTTIENIWKKQGFFMDDISCCGDECEC